MGVSLVPSISTIESVPYLIKMDFENSVDIVMDFTDYIVINVTQRDKSKVPLENEIEPIVKQVRKKMIMNLGKTAAYEYSNLIKKIDTSPEWIDISHETRKVWFRNSLINKNNVPLLLLKIDSYLLEEQYKAIAEVMQRNHVDGAIVGSTIPINVGIKDKSKRILNNDLAIWGAGGEITKDYSIYALKAMYKYTQGKKLLISSGGIFTGKDMYDRISYGANLVQIYTALAIYGPYKPKQILDEFWSLWKENNTDPQKLVGSFKK